jgi:hypothetical protein
MTGAEHYTAAEQLLDMATDHGNCAADDYAHEAYLLAKAQVHATLAQAASRLDVSTCQHGMTGLCMHCLIPIVEFSLSPRR